MEDMNGDHMIKACSRCRTQIESLEQDRGRGDKAAAGRVLVIEMTLINCGKENYARGSLFLECDYQHGLPIVEKKHQHMFFVLRREEVIIPNPMD
ncbi:hypothetical protein ACTXT7_015761 [Hymenolepis weldensis]